VPAVANWISRLLNIGHLEGSLGRPQPPLDDKSAHCWEDFFGRGHRYQPLEVDRTTPEGLLLLVRGLFSSSREAFVLARKGVWPRH